MKVRELIQQLVDRNQDAVIVLRDVTTGKGEVAEGVLSSKYVNADEESGSILCLEEGTSIVEIYS